MKVMEWHAITDDDRARRAVKSRVMTRVQVSLRIPGTAPMPELIRLIRDVESAGWPFQCRQRELSPTAVASVTSATSIET